MQYKLTYTQDNRDIASFDYDFTEIRGKWQPTIYRKDGTQTTIDKFCATERQAHTEAAFYCLEEAEKIAKRLNISKSKVYLKPPQPQGD